MWSSSEFLTWMFGKRGHDSPSKHIIIMPAHIRWQWHQIPITSFFKTLPLQINLASALGGEYTGQTVCWLSQQQVGRELATGMWWLKQNIECCVLTVRSYWGTLYCRWSSFHIWFGSTLNECVGLVVTLYPVWHDSGSPLVCMCTVFHHILISTFHIELQYFSNRSF